VLCSRLIDGSGGYAGLSRLRYGYDGHFMKSEQLDCADDAVAIESAKQLIDGHDIELWQRDRRIVGFDAKSE
jgi:hypothetical protein